MPTTRARRSDAPLRQQLIAALAGGPLDASTLAQRVHANVTDVSTTLRQLARDGALMRLGVDRRWALAARGGVVLRTPLTRHLRPAQRSRVALAGGQATAAAESPTLALTARPAASALHETAVPKTSRLTLPQARCRPAGGPDTGASASWWTKPRTREEFSSVARSEFETRIANGMQASQTPPFELPPPDGRRIPK